MIASAHAELLDDSRLKTDEFLREFIAERLTKAESISPAYANLWRAIEMLVGSGGKRLRPYMVALSYGAFGKDESLLRIVPAMAAQELFHQAVLIHDDIIDRDTMRYGVANVTGQYEAFYNDHIESATERRHFANSAALLAGDLLLSSAYQVLQRMDIESDRLSSATETFAEAIFDVSGGELLDTETAFRTADRADPQAIALYKTARYSFVSPLVMGAQLAGADSQTIAALHAYGEHLGIAFQMQDDLLGVYGDSSKTGKSTSSDIREGKYTKLVDEFDARASSAQTTRFYEIFHNSDASDVDIDEARQLLEASGARMAVEELIISYRDEAVAALDGLNMNNGWHDEFVKLSVRATKRNY